jgi:hypothetical protein
LYKYFVAQAYSKRKKSCPFTDRAKKLFVWSLQSFDKYFHIAESSSGSGFPLLRVIFLNGNFLRQKLQLVSCNALQMRLKDAADSCSIHSSNEESRLLAALKEAVLLADHVCSLYDVVLPSLLGFAHSDLLDTILYYTDILQYVVQEHI